MKHKIHVLLMVLAMALGLITEARSDYTYTYTTIDYPGASETYPYGINDSDQIVGGFKDATGVHGFYYDGLSTFKKMDFPGSNRTTVDDINDYGQMVGNYVMGVSNEYGFIYSGGIYTTIDYPDPTHTYTKAMAISNSGWVVGYYYTGPGTDYTNMYSYIYVNGTFTSFQYPNAYFTRAMDVNDYGYIVGCYNTYSPVPGEFGFLYVGGAFTQLAVPGAQTTRAFGITNSGHITGVYKDGLGWHGFLYDGTYYKNMNYPIAGDARTFPQGINNKGRITGYFQDPTDPYPYRGFLTCPSASNPDQSDTDGDTISDACDNCPDIVNPDQANSDADGLGNTCDNCPDIENQDQVDSDSDGVGDLCDNCPALYNPDQSGTDTDGDTIPDICDNCTDKVNTGQEDFDNDGQGDTCDCDDGYWGPGENGADCGGDCADACPTWCVPIIQYGDTNGKIDIVFIPSEEYASVGGDQLGTGLPVQWQTDTLHLIKAGFYEADVIKEEWNRRKINFWYLRQWADFTEECAIGTTCEDCIEARISSEKTKCERDAPRRWEEVCPHGDIGVIVHIECCRDFSRGDVFSTGNDAPGTFRHEAGHALFDLGDEYDDSPDCGTHYHRAYPFSNIFRTYSGCYMDSLEPGFCDKFTECQGDWWKAQPEGTTMDVNSRIWGPDAERQVRWVLYWLVDPPPDNTRKAIVAYLHYSGGGVGLNSISIVYGDVPERVINPTGLRIVSLNTSDMVINDFRIRHPAYVHYYSPRGGEWLAETDFTVVLPFIDDIKTIQIFDVLEILDDPSNMLLGTIDLFPAISAFCAEHIDDPQCISYDGLDSDGDGVLNSSDNCPNTPNPEQTDSDADNTGDACDGCPGDSGKTAPGICGCNVTDTDSDSDGTPDCNDGCPDDPAKTIPGICDCGVPDTDFDGDGSYQCDDCNDNDPAMYSGAPEVCDRKDNDCDDVVDENLGTTTCGVGACQRTIDNCINGVVQTCIPGNPSPEVCNNADDDCDSMTDEDLGSTTCGVGDCQVTYPNCISGVPQVCTPLPPTAEVCDNIDNDCDGDIDEGFDADGDYVADCVDNCPSVHNPDQSDSDSDGLGDACESGGAKTICSILGNDRKPSIIDQDIFKFNGTKGEIVTVRLEANPSGVGTGKRVTLILSDKIKGTILVRLDRSELPNEITAKLPTSGEYLITVAQTLLISRDKRYSGEYCLTLNARPETYQTLAPYLWVE